MKTNNDINNPNLEWNESKGHGLLPIQSTSKSLLTILKLIDTNEYKIPSFQRGVAWPEKKIVGFGNTILRHYKETFSPEGTILIFQLLTEEKKGNPIYILDGTQRINAMKNFKYRPNLWGLSEEDSIKILDYVEYPIRNYIFNNLQEAIDAYQRINQGTILTPYEYYIVTINLMEGDSEILKLLEDMFGECEKYLEIEFGIQILERENNHTFRRVLMALFWFYWQNEFGRYSIPQEAIKGGVNQFHDKRKIQIEYKIKDMFEQFGIGPMQDKIIDFNRWFKNYIVLINEEYKKAQQIINSTKRMQKGLLYAILQMCIWAYHNKRPKNILADYIYKLFVGLKDGVILIVNNKKIASLSTTSGATQLPKICIALNSDLYDFDKREKRESAGFGREWHHDEEPFSKAGEGHVIKTSTVLNRSMGNKGNNIFT